MSTRMNSMLLPLISLVALLAPAGLMSQAATVPSSQDQAYEHEETQSLVALVNDASDLIQAEGEAAFTELSTAGSQWRQDDTYIFVLDPRGNMLVHPDPALEGKNLIDLEDINGKPIIRDLIAAATTTPNKRAGWYHYEWPVPHGLLPRWKSTYVRAVEAPSGKEYIVAAGVYNDRMERAFVVDMVTNAVNRIETDGEAAFEQFRDPKGPFIAKDSYIFVFDPNGVDLVNPAFPNLEGRNLMDLKDTQGKELVREMMHVAQTKDSGWVDYMWPKPGESVSTQKSAYVSRAKLAHGWVLVGCGVYLADAPKAARAVQEMTAPELMALVREGATLLEAKGEKAYPEFRTKGSRWFQGDTYFFIWKMDGTRVLHAADPGKEGVNDSEATDVLGRPYGKMFLEAANNPTGEGWVHYVYPEPGSIFPIWKSTFVKRVTYPDGEQYLIGSGVYNMQMDKAFIEDVVNRAADLVAKEGDASFAELRDRKGPYYFMDTYVFVMTPEGLEVVNAGQPSMEGTNILNLKDVNGKDVTRQCLEQAEKNGSGWVEYHWYKPGSNTPTRKMTYVRQVHTGTETYVVGSGLYMEEEETHISAVAPH